MININHRREVWGDMGRQECTPFGDVGSRRGEVSFLQVSPGEKKYKGSVRGVMAPSCKQQKLIWIAFQIFIGTMLGSLQKNQA